MNPNRLLMLTFKYLAIIFRRTIPLTMRHRIGMDEEKIMDSKKSFLLLIILLIGSPLAFATSWKSENRKHGRQPISSQASEQEKGYGAWVGFTMSRALLRDCEVFIGRLQDVVAPDEEQARTVDRRSLSYPKVTVAVEEWLYGNQQHYADVLQLEQVPLVRGPMYGSEYRGAVWRDVEVKMGARVLVFFYPKSSPDTKVQKAIDRYSLVISKE